MLHTAENVKLKLNQNLDVANVGLCSSRGTSALGARSDTLHGFVSFQLAYQQLALRPDDLRGQEFGQPYVYGDMMGRAAFVKWGYKL
jgi:hypothetical protein